MILRSIRSDKKCFLKLTKCLAALLLPYPMSGRYVQAEYGHTLTPTNWKRDVHIFSGENLSGLPDGLFSYQKSQFGYMYCGGPWNGECWYIL
jgi:hypothetical protein